MFPRPEMNAWSMSSAFSLALRRTSISPNCCQVKVCSRGSMAMWSSSRTFPRSSGVAANSSPKVRGSTYRRSPPCWNRITTWVCWGGGVRLVPRRNRPLIPKWATSTLPSSSCSRMYLPFRSALAIFRPVRRSRNSRGVLCRRITRLVFLVRLTSTSPMRRPTTSFSRSLRRPSTSGSSINPATRPPASRLSRSHGAPLGPEPVVRLAGGPLLRLLLRSPPPGPVGPAVQENGGREFLGVVRPPFLHPVLGHRPNVLGGQLLEAGLVVSVTLASGVGGHPGPEQPGDQLGARPQPPVQVRRSQDGLHGVREDGRLVPAAGQLLPPAQQELLPQAQLAGHLGEGEHVHGGRPKLGQLALGQIGEPPVGQVGDHHAQDGVAQELQALV